MNKWTKHTLMTKGFPVKVYINSGNTQAIIFPLFGKYYKLGSDVNVLDFAVDFITNAHADRTLTHANYLNSLEDTAVINLETLAA